MNPSDIRQLEEVSLNTTPAARELVHDGWLLRLTGGATRRVNSVQPLYPGKLDTLEKIRFCESVYAHNGLPTIFKMTEAAVPGDLDQILAREGYEANNQTSVQTCSVGASARSIETSAPFEEWDDPGEAWLTAKRSARNLEHEVFKFHLAVVSAIALPKRFFAIMEEGRAVCCGYGVVQCPWVGLFDIHTKLEFRNRGLASHLVARLLQWGRGNGAGRGYLQVDATNAAALRLYARFGFVDQYCYWYRSKGLP